MDVRREEENQIVMVRFSRFLMCVCWCILVLIDVCVYPLCDVRLSEKNDNENNEGG